MNPELDCLSKNFDFLAESIRNSLKSSALRSAEGAAPAVVVSRQARANAGTEYKPEAGPQSSRKKDGAK